ncbi:uncharacterized protein LOC126325053 [Schistocerca gregaria]|uniref:uncharacterized protein LOC126325053 n=1 Tax=Schistocerca gregaria TaxID=7010 RepID=UPI00211DB5E6|nr:uncharacterized protein LOC126325053 [Schistocerca gregaria]
MGLVSKLRIGLKLFELALACACIGTFTETQLHTVLDVYILEITTYSGYVIIMSGFLIGYMTGERIPPKMDLLLTAVGGVLFVVSGSLRVHGTTFKPDYYKPESLSNTCGALAIVNGFFFAADALAWFRDVNEYSPH